MGDFMNQEQLDLNIEDQAAQCAEEAVYLTQEPPVPVTKTKMPPKPPTPAQLMIAARFRQARDLSGFKSEKEATIRMGLRNPKVISQIENCHRQPTLYFVIRAAEAYGVSADFLLGMSEDDDRSSDIATRSVILKQNTKMVEMFAGILSKTTYDYAKNVGDETTQQLAETAEALYVKFTRFCQLNPEFENMRGGAPVQHLILSLMPTVKRIKKRLEARDNLIALHNQQLNHLVQRQLFGGNNG